MAPTLFNRLSSYMREPEKVELPMLSSTTAAALSILFTAAYVLPFYLSPTTRPSPTLSRDAPSVIRARIRFVTLSVTISTLLTAYILSLYAHLPSRAILHTLGLYPISPLPILNSLLLTSLLFAGPLFEKAIIAGRWRSWVQGSGLHETLSSWIGWRNYITGPLTEEILFRAIILSLHTHTTPPTSPLALIFATPLYFGIAHVHHFYEFTLTHPHTTLGPALLRSVAQLGYTTLFGWYAAFLYLRTGSLWAVVLVHAACNWMGLPRFWGRVGGVEVQGGIVGGATRAKEDDGGEMGERRYGGLGLGWTVVYYLVLVAGAVAWWNGMWVLTESEGALIDLGVGRGMTKRGAK